MAFLNGAFRQLVLEPRLGEMTAHQVGTIIGICLALVIMYFFFRFIGRRGVEAARADLLLVGGLWVALTVLFEFGFFGVVRGVPWEKLLADYNILKGRLWPAFLLSLLIGPLLVGSLARR